MNTDFAPLTLAEFSLGNIISKSWQILKRNWLFLLGLLVFQFVFQMIIQAIVGSIPESESGALALASLVVWIISLVISIGWLNIYIKMARGENIELRDIFTKYDRALPYVLGNIVTGLMILFGLLIFIIPGVILSLQYMFVPYLLVDRKIGIGQALKLSGQMTKGYKMRLLGYAWCFVALVLVSALALFVGIFVTIPLVTIAYGVMYVALLERAEPTEAA